MLKELSKLPPKLHYVGYIFSLRAHTDRRGVTWLGYFLTGIVTQKKDKKNAFKNGVWIEKNRVVVSSQGSNYLFKTIVFEDDTEAIQILRDFLDTHGLLPPPQYNEQTENTEYQEIYLNLLT